MLLLQHWLLSMATVMSPTPNQPIFGKRRARDGLEHDHKRVRLDRLLSKLSLEQDEPPAKRTPLIEPDLEINPLLDFSDEDKRPKSGIDAYISEKLIASMQERVKEGLAVGRWYIPAGIVILHFQRWVRRLFNSFIKRYNASHPDKAPVSPFRSYNKIVKLVCSPDMNFSVDDLRQILMDENHREQRDIARRKLKREDKRHIEEIKEEEGIFATTSYTYWDRFAEVSRDIDMDIELLSAAVSDGLDLDMMDM